MKTKSTKFRNALNEASIIEQQNLEKEMVGMEEHIFSNDFIDKMAKLGIVESS